MRTPKYPEQKDIEITIATINRLVHGLTYSPRKTPWYLWPGIFLLIVCMRTSALMIERINSRVVGDLGKP